MHLGALLLETPKEAWILSGTKISVNCSLIFNDSKKVKIHWEKNGTMVNHISNKFLQEVSLNDKGVQLQFINAKEADAGIYKCVAEEENGKRCNATSNIHIGSEYHVLNISNIHSLINLYISGELRSFGAVAKSQNIPQ